MVNVSSNGWGHIEELLALVAEQVNALIRVTVMAHRDPKKSAPQFGPAFEYPRPHRAKRDEKRAAVHPRDVARRMLMGGG